MNDLLDAALGPLKVKVWLAIFAGLAMVAGIAIKIADNRDKRLIQTAADAGAAEAIIEGQNSTLDQLGDANDAEEEIRRNGERSAARFDDCMRNNRRKGACERYRPIENQLVPGRP